MKNLSIMALSAMTLSGCLFSSSDNEEFNELISSAEELSTAAMDSNLDQVGLPDTGTATYNGVALYAQILDTGGRQPASIVAPTGPVEEPESTLEFAAIGSFTADVDFGGRTINGTADNFFEISDGSFMLGAVSEQESTANQLSEIETNGAIEGSFSVTQTDRLNSRVGSIGVEVEGSLTSTDNSVYAHSVEDKTILFGDAEFLGDGDTQFMDVQADLESYNRVNIFSAFSETGEPIAAPPLFDQCYGGCEGISLED